MKEPISLTVRARGCALAWYNAFLASGSDASKPSLYQTLALEFYLFGIQMIGCDGSALFRAWVPTVDNEGEDKKIWPNNTVSPLRTVVVMDHEGFGLGYMRQLLKVTNDDAYALESLTITTAEGDSEATPALGDEFKTERIILRSCGQRADLRLYEAAFPDWRNLKLGVDWDTRVEGLKISARLLGLVSKLKGVNSADLQFHGKQKFVGFTGRGPTDDIEVQGLLMPMVRESEPKK